MKKPNIVFKSLLKGISSIAERNKIFNSLSEEGQRLEIAWDCLQLLMEDKVKPSIGWYWDPAMRDEYASSTSKQIFRKFNNIKDCEVCARGAVMLSQIRLGNKIGEENVPSTCARKGVMYDTIQGNEVSLTAFSIDSLKWMEQEYENGHFNHPFETNSKEKLMNIMCNILVNGDFNTSDKTNYLINK